MTWEQGFSGLDIGLIYSRESWTQGRCQSLLGVGLGRGEMSKAWAGLGRRFTSSLPVLVNRTSASGDRLEAVSTVK